MSNLPPELLLEILVRLPPKDLLRCMCVSKSWYAFIRHQHFVKAHLQHSTKTNSAHTLLFQAYGSTGPQLHFFSSAFNEDETFGEAVKIEQPSKVKHSDASLYVLSYSINGLVCIHSDCYGDIVLWNPSIQKFKRIPLPMPTFQQAKPAPYGFGFGFGYDSLNDDYKLVLIGEFGDRRKWGNTIIYCYKAQIYSLKSNSWKRINQNMPGTGNGCAMVLPNIVFSNGALSWQIYNNRRRTILTLDLATEKYKEFPTPVTVNEHHDPKINLRVLADCLCICVSHSGSKHDVWIMKEYGVIESWTLLYSIEPKALPWMIGCWKPFFFSNNGKMVLSVIDDFKIFCWFDLETKVAKQVEIPTQRWTHFFQPTVCVGSLCLLDGDSVFVGRQQQQQQEASSNSSPLPLISRKLRDVV